MTTTAADTGPGDPLVADPLGRVQAYQLGLEAIRAARLDAVGLGADPLTREIGGQLLRAAASIAANVAEGYSRGTVSDRRKFFEYALGSTRETIVWYEAAAHPECEERLARLVSIRRLLLTMIRTCRTQVARDTRSFKR